MYRGNIKISFLLLCSHVPFPQMFNSVHAHLSNFPPSVIVTSLWSPLATGDTHTGN